MHLASRSMPLGGSRVDLHCLGKFVDNWQSSSGCVQQKNNTTKVPRRQVL